MTKLVTAPMACGAVMVPTSMFMGQVVTAYNPFTGQQVGTKQRRRTVLWLVIGIVQACEKRNKNDVQGLGHLKFRSFWFR